MKNIFILSFMLIVTISCKETFKDIEDPGWDKTEVTNTVTVMSYNVHYCAPKGSNDADVDAIAEVIINAKPDIVFMQEVDKNTTRSKKIDQLKELSKKTNMPYYYYSRAIDYQGGQMGNGTLSRYELSHTQTHKLPRVNLGPDVYVSDRVLSTATVTINDRKITIANTHLALTDENKALQVPEINKILSSMNQPVIFGGDFNATPQHNAMVTFFGYDFKKTCSTNCNTLPSDAPNREIDYILLRPTNNFEVLGHQVVTSLASDHLPIVSVIKVL